MFKAKHSRKSAVSIKMFIKEFGEDFPAHVKERLMDLEVRCFLTRKEIAYRFDLKHVEHLQYQTTSDEVESSAPCSKEYAYGQFVVLDGKLYFSESCLENKDIMQSPMVSIIYNALNSEEIIELTNLKRLDDNNIDFVVDKILSSCPEVSQSYIDITQGMISRSNNK
ncbi:hypothetical protein [Clostridium cellulovorans]|uniref:Uncharacterized protein n=1 Tax=Clostridium cellulovorans (strain ATCC 35296 / DSM 3052 / OCM 3 / 743B) TaxID=573061 RepID=D9SRB4_CLOC7|nr:hypothetical protein [Clostridium cellulovorans]ADL52343.1 hypothetical protein Clocel_2640 [Clostridium cellulovorans 743B]